MFSKKVTTNVLAVLILVWVLFWMSPFVRSGGGKGVLGLVAVIILIFGIPLFSSIGIIVANQKL
jgi:hypothetical protein